MTYHSKLDRLDDRESFIENLKYLSNVDYQERVWCKHPYGIDNEIEYMTYDVVLGLDPQEVPKFIGSILKDEKEAALVLPVVTAFRNVCWNIYDSNHINKSTKNETFLSSPLWHDLVAKAKVAYEYFKENG